MTVEAASLAALRARIDEADRRLVRILAERQRLTEAVADLKGDAGAVHDPRRVHEVLAHVREAADAAGLSRAIALPLWRRLIACFTRHQIDRLARLDSDQTLTGEKRLGLKRNRP